MRVSISPPIDRLLGGGLEPGCITNFYGPPASGKSLMCFCATVSAVKSGKKVLFVDTEGGFSRERLRQICPDFEFRKVRLLEPGTWEDQAKTIRRIPSESQKCGLIVVDSIVALWRIAINERNAQAVNRELATQLSILSRIAREREIPVVITNQVYADLDTGKIEMSSRNIVKWWSKNIVELSHAGRTGHRIARVVRGRSLPEDARTEFQIVEEGIKEVSRLRLF